MSRKGGDELYERAGRAPTAEVREIENTEKRRLNIFQYFIWYVQGAKTPVKDTTVERCLKIETCLKIENSTLFRYGGQLVDAFKYRTKRVVCGAVQYVPLKHRYT